MLAVLRAKAYQLINYKTNFKHTLIYNTMYREPKNSMHCFCLNLKK